MATQTVTRLPVVAPGVVIATLVFGPSTPVSAPERDPESF